MGPVILILFILTEVLCADLESNSLLVFLKIFGHLIDHARNAKLMGFVLLGLFHLARQVHSSAAEVFERQQILYHLKPGLVVYRTKFLKTCNLCGEESYFQWSIVFRLIASSSRQVPADQL